MFDIGFAELLLLAVIALLVLGPDRLPGAIRTASLWLGKLRRSFNEVKAEIEREIDADEIKRELHNNSIMQQLGEEAGDIKDNLQEVRNSLKDLEFDLDSNNSGHGDYEPGQSEIESKKQSESTSDTESTKKSDDAHEQPIADKGPASTND